jgi:hypothetical protein
VVRTLAWLRRNNGNGEFKPRRHKGHRGKPGAWIPFSLCALCLWWISPVPAFRLPPWTFGFSPAPSNPVKVGQGQSRSSLPNRRHPRPAPHAPSLAPSRVKPSQGRPSARHPGPKTQAPRPQTPDPRPKTPDPRPKTPDPRPQTQDPRPKTQDPRPKTQNPSPENRVSQTFRGRAVSHPAATRPADVNHPCPLTRATRPDLGCQTSSKPV